MRIVVFEDVSATASSSHARRVGAWVGDDIVDLQRAATTLPADLGAFIAGGEPALEHARAAVERASREKRSDVVIARDRVRLFAPTVYRPRIACAAGNYAEHTLGSAARKGASSALADLAPAGATLTAAEVVEKTRERDRPRGFWKDFALPVGPEGEIPYPARAEHFDYEGEVAAVIGGAPKDVAKGQGASYIWGVTLLNDWSIRGQNVKDSLTFNLGKNFDGGASVGPCIVVGGDPNDLVVETRVNGELRQHYNSGDMIFSHAEYLEYLSRDFTFLPGDMIAGGSGPGSATDSAKQGQDLWLKVGDVVEVSSPQIGVLRNRIVAKR
jgi:2-keto-4-pentenoate hydratase/2-oxohepta-3-ene-1,7-dioic acid hydratase in catechol pathway